MKRIYKNDDDLLIHAKETENKLFKDFTNSYKLDNGKGSIGHFMETEHFGYKINSRSEPDFVNLGVELKVTPFIHKTNRYVAKERLVLNIINYMKEFLDDFYKSSFWMKNRKLLIMFYEYKKEIKKENWFISKVILYKYPNEDLIIIKKDWEIIVSKIKDGLAHELSESDTMYLGACTKGATRAKSMRIQPFSELKAPQRAYSLKQSYMTFLLNNYVFGEKNSESIIKHSSNLANTSFTDFIVHTTNKYIGKTQKNLCEYFDVNIKSKNANELIISKMFGNKGKISQSNEFKKANIIAKTIKVEKNGSIKESMSFKTFKFNEIINEQWEDSYMFNLFSTTKFMFIIFKYNSNNELVFNKIKFWNMPYNDLLEFKKVWEKTKKILINGLIIHISPNGYQKNNFPKRKDSPIGHVRPHGQNAQDTYSLPTVGSYTKQSFWLNNTYIKSQL